MNKKMVSIICGIVIIIIVLVFILFNSFSTTVIMVNDIAPIGVSNGDEVSVTLNGKTDNYYIVGEDGNNYLLLTKYTLLKSDDAEGKIKSVEQSATYEGYKFDKGSSNGYNGYWHSSSNSYPSYFEDDPGYNLNNFEANEDGRDEAMQMVKMYGADRNVTSRLMTVKEMKALGCTISSNSVPTYLRQVNGTNRYWWLGSADSYDSVWVEGGDSGVLGKGSFSLKFGVRPVVLVKKSAFKKYTNSEIPSIPINNVSYAVGDTIEKNGETFFVIEASDTTDSIVKVIAKSAINTDTLKQEEYASGIAFSTSNYWYDLNTNSLKSQYGTGYGENCNLTENDEIEVSDGKMALYAAQQYGIKLGAEKGRLMTYKEANWLKNNGYTSLLYANYGKFESAKGEDMWLGSAYDDHCVLHVYSDIINYSDINIDDYNGIGVIRPVLEFLKSSI